MFWAWLAFIAGSITFVPIAAAALWTKKLPDAGWECMRLRAFQAWLAVWTVGGTVLVGTLVLVSYQRDPRPEPWLYFVVAALGLLFFWLLTEEHSVDGEIGLPAPPNIFGRIQENFPRNAPSSFVGIVAYLIVNDTAEQGVLKDWNSVDEVARNMFAGGWLFVMHFAYARWHGTANDFVQRQYRERVHDFLADFVTLGENKIRQETESRIDEHPTQALRGETAHALLTQALSEPDQARRTRKLAILYVQLFGLGSAKKLLKRG